MKTISELNSKIWYRILKVAYVLFFIPLFICAIISGYLINLPKFDSEKSYIKCGDGRQLGLEENGIHLYSPYVYSWEGKEIKKLCLSGKYKNNTTGEILTAQTYVDKFGIDSINDNFIVVPVHTKVNWFFVIGLSLLSIIATRLLWELIKRIFYYIVLGNFRPKK